MRRFPKRESSGVRSPLEQEAITLEEGPVLDETTFQQILAAAYVLQQQKDAHPQNPTQPQTQPGVSTATQPDAAQTLAQIVETQELVRQRPYDVVGAAKLVAQRLLDILHADGVAIALVSGDELEYCAALGTAAQLAGMRIPVGPELSSLGQQTDSLLQHGPADTKLSPEPLNGHHDSSSIALPLHREGKLVGLIEVRFATPDSIQEHEIRTCQLMAGLMTEAMARAAELEWRHILANERATMLEALERIKPQLERLAVEAPTEIANLPGEKTKSATQTPPATTSIQSEPDVESGESATCPQCGYQFSIGELFCGRCGTKRPSEISNDLQSKWASLWELQQAAEKEDEEEAIGTDSKISSELSDDARISPVLEEIIAQFSDEETLAKPSAEAAPVPDDNSALTIEGETALAEPTVSPDLGEQPKPASPWSSASKTHKWLESVEAKGAGQIWAQRGNIYIGLALILLLAVLYGWDSQPQSRSGHMRSVQPRLTLLEKTLVALGLAEAPTQPVYQGNPNAEVWIDLHTALYYCSGADLYGKTPGGRYTTQRDAQLDQFEPAARRPCE